ncbi:hypothetical protein, conserved [Plasmodium gonderi]|uniref:Uncharacterized protein n=1 Tax=Plasmodium gonderi TaxID=77519 RepID=A0A1Y1JDS8_PLAGO|nr:hypothetical protein, conserved [Plasmodium gonderi]GAW79367.1 hypothetical protein, conserved [Plasmodium gonderi]
MKLSFLFCFVFLFLVPCLFGYADNALHYQIRRKKEMVQEKNGLVNQDKGISTGDITMNSNREGEMIYRKEPLPELQKHTGVDLDGLVNFADPNELYKFLTEDTDGSEESKSRNNSFSNLKGAIKGSNMKKEIFLTLYKSALSHFDVDGYNVFMENIMTEKRHNNDEFLERRKRKKYNRSYPHCDRGPNGMVKLERSTDKGNYQSKDVYIKETRITGGREGNVEYPGGPIRSVYGNNLSKWMKDSLEDIETPASIKEPGLANMLMQSLTMVKGLIQSVASSVVDIVPPLIPPPVWINRPLPCLPMVTGKNCLGSVLYPITAAEFVTADITDSIMNGVISSFPAKYASKVGKTSDTQYRICAMAYLGMYCASIFPICWLPIGLKVAETMSVCFPQCLATLIACPGFWIDDIEGPCNNASVPPFCSFSVFVNQKIVPPQLTSYDDSHMYPSSCPEKDEEYDLLDELYDHEDKKFNNVYNKEKNSYSKISLPTYPDLIPNIYDKQEHRKEELEACKCMNIIQLCRKHFAIPVIAKYHTLFDTTHEEPVKLSPLQTRCCRICKPIWLVLFPRKRIIDLRGSPVYPKRKTTMNLSNLVLH